uniref:Uncharacterized protein n=1 Tax=Eutreptiella gymnastica TaxID=73025 RepID=A0A7S1I1M3_9EUGL|mmetsp:Transcript_121601/g.211239  ORF Transcript_121601/g.211239 Transcript_121601/m.211239 type:complete len:104 (+) Transcript_121601:800-1111(+)
MAFFQPLLEWFLHPLQHSIPSRGDPEQVTSKPSFTLLPCMDHRPNPTYTSRCKNKKNAVLHKFWSVFVADQSKLVFFCFEVSSKWWFSGSLSLVAHLLPFSAT